MTSWHKTVVLCRIVI